MSYRGSKTLAVLASCFSIVLATQTFAHSGGNHNPAPVDACRELKKTAECSYTNHDGDLYKGTCRVFSETLLCVRNEPIVKAIHSHSSEALSSEKGKVKNSDITAK